MGKSVQFTIAVLGISGIPINLIGQYMHFPKTKVERSFWLEPFQMR